MIKGYWFSRNADKAWAEKFYLIFLPLFFAYNAALQQLGWVDVGNFWHVTQNLLMWVPYCVLLPMVLRRGTGIPVHRQYWFKFQLFMVVWVFFATYFHTEWFFEVLGMRYNFPNVSLYFDSRIAGPDEATALTNHEKIPVGMYLNAIAFFTVYHTAAVVVMRRVRSMTDGLVPAVRKLAWFAIVAATAWFFAYAETFFYIQPEVASTVYYLDRERMLAIGSICYALYFIVSFPNLYRLDEPAAQGAEGSGPTWEPWTLSRCVIEAGFVSIVSLFLIDLFAWIYGPLV